MITDTQRIEWMEQERAKNGDIHFTRYGQSWIQMFTISTQHLPRKPTIREAIDAAITKMSEGA